MREQIDEFVTKNRDATRLKSDHGNSGFDFGREFIENLQQKRLSAIEHPVVVERAPAAEVGSWHDDAKARSFEDIDRGLRGSGLEVIIKSVGPEENRRRNP